MGEAGIQAVPQLPTGAAFNLAFCQQLAGVLDAATRQAPALLPLTALPQAACIALLKRAEKLLRGEPTLVHVSRGWRCLLGAAYCSCLLELHVDVHAAHGCRHGSVPRAQLPTRLPPSSACCVASLLALPVLPLLTPEKSNPACRFGRQRGQRWWWWGICMGSSTTC